VAVGAAEKGSHGHGGGCVMVRRGGLEHAPPILRAASDPLLVATVCKRRAIVNEDHSEVHNTNWHKLKLMSINQIKHGYIC
jgi:hypothetical protein